MTHPANWGPYKLDLLRQAIRLADLDDVVMVTEPEAAAIHYASQARVEPGAVIAVYDLGGGTFDAAVLRKTDDGWDVLGHARGHRAPRRRRLRRRRLPPRGAAPSARRSTSCRPTTPPPLAAAARLRQECVDAKEALSADSDVSIPVLLPDAADRGAAHPGRVRADGAPGAGRHDHGAHAGAALGGRRARRRHDRAAGRRVVAHAARRRAGVVALGRPVAVDAHPKYGVALGAAITAAVAGGKRSAATTPR